MRITRVDARPLRLPPAGAKPLPVAGAPAATRPGLTVLLVQLETDAGITGLGFGSYPGGGRSLLACVEDDLTPLVTGEDPLQHERLWAKTRPVENPSAYAPIDIALWDLKAK